ncbi:DNA/RNA non-specific endonuclease [Paraburkholderia fungorum]|uniref:DNA/RNA non-specific endonuclease n=1 Tax=Paraburkholderia fungorum TaxID=134537 RepID=UPI0038B9942B
MLICESKVLDSESRLPTNLTHGAATLLTGTTKRPVSWAGEEAVALVRSRVANLSFAGARPSPTELERLIGNNDLVDEFYLRRALVAAQPVMRVIVRDDAGRERGWATGFMVSPRLLLTNNHVFQSIEDAKGGLAEANYVLDIAGNPETSYRFNVRADLFFITDVGLDFTLVAVEPTSVDGKAKLSDFGYHKLVAEPNKIQVGESMTLIQHPGGERRQFSIRENQLFEIHDNFLWYRSDTAPGSSGAPAYNDSFQVVALHHSGAARRSPDGKYLLKDGTAVDSLDGIDDSKIDWVANEGVRISVLCRFLQGKLGNSTYANELVAAMTDAGDVMSMALSGRGSNPKERMSSQVATQQPSSTAVTIPLELNVIISSPSSGGSASAPLAISRAVSVGEEVAKSPKVDTDYTTRTGYNESFLGVNASLPRYVDKDEAVTLRSGSPFLNYEHFTVVLSRRRRIPMFTASNVDYSQQSRQPEQGDYSRKGLGKLGPNDTEKWIIDPRIPAEDQLPDVFYTKDGGAFDKGHVVRRDDVCWGDSYAQIVRANGDTFHVTNCTPQVKGFNRSNEGVDNWGDLENEVQKQGKSERLSIFAGPVISPTDPIFDGKDDNGPIKVQVPMQFWKVVLTGEGKKLRAYGFVLKQDLSSVPTEFSVTPTWTPYLVSIQHLVSLLTGFTFPSEVIDADQSVNDGQELSRRLGVTLHESLK